MDTYSVAVFIEKRVHTGLAGADDPVMPAVADDGGPTQEQFPAAVRIPAFDASEYQQAIDSGALQLGPNEKRVFTREALRGLAHFWRSQHRTKEEWATLRKAAAKRQQQGLPATKDTSAKQGQAEAFPADESAGSDAKGAQTGNAEWQLSPKLLEMLCLTANTAWLARANKESLVLYLEYRRYPQKRQWAQEAGQQLTPGMVQSALTELLWNTSNYPKSYDSLLAIAYPFGTVWLKRNSRSLWHSHVQGNFGTQGCITHRHIDGLAEEEGWDEQRGAVWRQHLGQPLPPGPPGMSVDEWAMHYLDSQRL